MQMRDAMTKDPVCCTPDTTIEAAARMMLERDCGAIPVVADLASRTPVGIITDRDIVTRVVAKGIDPMGLSVRECMTAPAVTILEDAGLDDCVELLQLGQLRRVIVVDRTGACVGIVAQADIARCASKRETGDLVREVSKPTEPAFTS
jgi:CBS domain-containing protein